MSTTYTRRPGPVTLQAVAYVRDHPGCAKYEVAHRVGPHGSNRFGDRTAWRAINRGLIENKSDDPTRYALYVTDAGRAAVALAYRDAANYPDELPSTVQAVTWVVRREQEK